MTEGKCNWNSDERAAAKALAVRYQAWHEARDMEPGPERDNSIRVWGRLLLESMEITGVQLSGPENIISLMAAAARRAA